MYTLTFHSEKTAFQIQPATTAGTFQSKDFVCGGTWLGMKGFGHVETRRFKEKGREALRAVKGVPRWAIRSSGPCHRASRASAGSQGPSWR